MQTDPSFTSRSKRQRLPRTSSSTRRRPTAGEAAQRVGVYVETIYDACKTGGLKHARIGGRRSIRIQAEWLDDWMSEFIRDTTADAAKRPKKK